MCNITKHIYFVLAWIAVDLMIGFSCVQAGVYQCISPSGTVEYRDRPCDTPQSQCFLPIQYSKTQAAYLKKQDKELQNINKQLDRQEKQLNRLNKKTAKTITTEKTKQERIKQKCAKLNEKIVHIESQLRAGCKIKKANRLKEELEVCRTMKEKICLYE